AARRPIQIPVRRPQQVVPNQSLRAQRLQRGWTQQELADQLGTTPLSVGRWERGQVVPGPYFRQRLCALFGTTAETLGLGAAPSPLRVPATVSSPGLFDPAIPSRPGLVGREELPRFGPKPLGFNAPPVQGALQLRVVASPEQPHQPRGAPVVTAPVAL